jgi:hypothetical protein
MDYLLVAHDQPLDMPSHYLAEVCRRTCERMRAGETGKDLVEELGVTMETLSLASTSADRRRRASRVKSYEAPLAAAQRRVKELEADLQVVKAASATSRTRHWRPTSSSPSAWPTKAVQ